MRKIIGKCEQCDKEFLFYQSSSKGRYCSHECYLGFKSRFSKIKKIKCECCGNIFVVNSRKSDPNERRFCSMKCYRLKRSSGFYKRKYICVECHNEYYAYAKESKFCSNDCFHKWSIGKHEAWNKGLKGIHLSPDSEFKPGPEHIFWKGGIANTPYPFEFNKDLKLYIKGIYGFTCQLCRKETKLTVHHIDYDKNNLKLNNLIPLCRSCHGKTNCYRDYWKVYLKNFVVFDENCPSEINVYKEKHGNNRAF